MVYICDNIIGIFGGIIDYHHILTVGFLLAEAFHTHSWDVLKLLFDQFPRSVHLENPRKGFNFSNSILGAVFYC